MSSKTKKPELLAPVANYTMLQAAIEGGCDAVYLGVKGQNMRLKARNFGFKDLKKITNICHKKNIRVYLTLNSIVYDSELKTIKSILKEAKEAKIDAVICWDFSVINEVKKAKIPIHISTQASISNFEAAKFMKKQGAKRIILARELSLLQIKKIKKNAKIEVEVFVHGAMCVSISGRCFLSEFTFNKSANKGVCLQPCRRTYIIKDKEEGFEYEIGNDYILSPKDLCTLPFIDEIIEMGVDSLKIEGRQKSPEYVYTVTKSYRTAIDAYFEKKLDEKLKKKLINDVKEVYNRGFSKGFYLKKPLKEWARQYGNIATEKKSHLGKVANFYKKNMVAEIKIDANNSLKENEEIYITGPTTGVIRYKVREMFWNDKKIKNVKKNDSFTIKLAKMARKNDQVYVIKKAKDF